METGVAVSQVNIVKANGVHEAFDPTKLRISLMKAGADEDAISSVMSEIMSNLRDGTTTHEIYRNAFRSLSEYQRPVAMRYSLRRAIMHMGPTGFPFEDLIAEIFKEQGYGALTRQTVLGGCVPHEVDVVAWNEKKLIMVEAKFHNELGIKSDIKVALYVKARVDDLKQNVFHFGDKDRKLSEGWLVTNTKFSSTAIHYGICENLVMIGWNYPEKGNLQDLISGSTHLLELVYKHAPLAIV